MTTYTLTAIELTGIQKYIFGSNNLQHIIGASELVRQATQDWVYQALNKQGPTNINEEGHFHEATITGDLLSSELVYVGGGNAVMLFKERQLAINFTRQLSRRVLQEAPGLNIVVAHVELDWANEPIKKKVDRAFQLLAQKKGHRVQSAPLLGLGITADCQFTGLPAVDMTGPPEEQRISAEIKAKQKAADDAHRRMKTIAAWPEGKFSAPKDFDHFGRTMGESSYIAVVHADGNDVGLRIKGIAKQYQTSGQNRDYIEAMRHFSKRVKEASTSTLRTIVQKLATAVDENHQIGGEIELTPGEIPGHPPYLPFRPLVFGGDDFTFVCDGRLGLALTAFYLDHFTTKYEFPPDDTPIYSKAGVAVVKTHYPFARAYELAEALTKSAKRYLAEDGQKKKLSTLDWHFAISGLVLPLQEIRRREYTVETGQLYMRPIWVAGQGDDWRSWQVFRQITADFKTESWPRSKVKALRDTLRAGKVEVKAFLRNNNSRLLNAVPHIEDLAKDGWHGERCGYFDAIEAIDFFVPLLWLPCFQDSHL